MTAGKRVGIVGAHGQIARQLSRELTSRGHAVRGLVRSTSQFDDLRSDGAEPALCDLEAAGESDIDEALAGIDVVVFAAGSGPDSGPERKRTLDRDGAIKAVESAVRVGAERFVIVSSMGADDPPSDDEVFSVYLRAKHDADVATRDASGRSQLSYTIVRPGKLNDDEPSGSVELAEHTRRAEISREDVADVIAELIHSGNGIDTTFEVVSGSTPTAEAVRALG